MPSHKLVLKKGSIVIFLRNLDSKNGLRNGTRLRVNDIFNELLLCEFVSGFRKGEKFLIPKID